MSGPIAILGGTGPAGLGLALRLARDGARVIFRTAAEKSIVDHRLSPEIAAQWTYLKDRSESLNKEDRSAIYGGFHIYERTA